MAESIIKLKVDSNEYESKLKRASAALISMADEAKRTGASLALADQQELAFVQSLGKLETSARGAKGTLGELSNTIQDLSMHYNKLSDEDRNSQYGQNLKKSIDELKVRHKELKGQMDDTSKSMDNHGGILDAISQKVGFNISNYTGFGIALAAASVAVKVATDAFKQNEELMDAWGKVVESSGSVYNGFLNALNSGDISGYLARIDNIIKASQDAYNALDDLATHNAFNQISIAKHRAAQTEAINNYKEGKGTKQDVLDAANAYQEDLQNRQKDEEKAYRSRVTQVALERGINPSQLMQILQMNQKDFDAIRNRSMTGKESHFYSSGWGPGVTNYTSVPANDFEKLGETLRQLPDDTIKELQELGAQSFNTAQEIEQNKKMVRRYTSGQSTRSSSTGSTKSTNNEPQFYADPQTLEELSKNISYYSKSVKLNGSEEDNILIENIKLWKEKKAAIESAMSESGKASIKPLDLSFSKEGISNYIKELQEDLRNVLKDIEDGNDLSLGEDAIKSIKNNIVDSATIANLFSTALQNGIDMSEFDGKKLWRDILNKEDIPDSYWQDLVKHINEKLSEAGIGQIQLNSNTGTISQVKQDKQISVSKKDKSDFEKATDGVSKSMNGLNQIAGGLKNMGVDLGEGFDKTLNVIQGLMSVIQGVQTFISLFSTTSMAANTAAIVANTSALVSNTVVNAIPFLAEGGVIPRAAEGLVVEATSLRFAEGGIPRAANGIIAGSLFHGDTRPIRVNDGEMIINQTDQAKLYNAIHGDSLSFSNGGGVDVVRGENIYLSMRNYMKRTGRRLPV